ncbi:MAG: lipopolysaccharide biosynthesis protein [Candidatus Deferrimicrobium sp.]
MTEVVQQKAGTKFWPSVGSVLSGMAIAQAIPLTGSLVLARIYSPMEFGTFSAWLGLVSLASVIITGRLEVALAIEEDGDPRKFAVLATLATIVLGCFLVGFVSVCVYLFAPSLPGVTPALVAAFAPAAMFAAGGQTWQSWAAAEGQYRHLSRMRIAQAVGVTATQIVVGLVAPTAIALAFGHLFGLLAGTCLAAYWMPLSFTPLRPLSVFVGNLKAFWRRNRRFPLLSLPADSITSASAQLPLLIITGKFGSEVGGLLALTMRVLGAPIGLLGTAVLDVFKRSSASSYRELGNCKRDYIRTFSVLAVCGLLLAAGVMLVSEPIFALAFGEPWRKAGVIAVWLMPMFALRFVASPLSYVYYIAGKQHVDFVWQCALLLMTVSVFLVPTRFETSVKAYSIGYGFLYLVYLAFSYRYSKGNTA